MVHDPSASVSQFTRYLISTAISAAVAAWCWARRAAAAGAAAYALVALSQATWTLGYALEVSSLSLGAKLFWDDVQVIASACWAIAFIAFTVQYTGRRLARPALTYGLIALPFVALVALALTDQWHELVRSRVRLVPTDSGSALVYAFTPAVWGAALYGYATYLACLGVLAVRLVGAAPLFQRQNGLILLGNAIPVVGTALGFTVLRESPNRDVSPLMVALGNVVVAWALARFRLFDLVPVARDVVVETMSDAIYVLDPHDRIVDLNPAARRICAAAGGSMIGKPAPEAFAAWPELIDRLRNDEPGPRVTPMDAAAGRRYFEVQTRTLRRSDGRSGGRVVVTHDVTERQWAEDELRRYRQRLEMLVRARTDELKTALAELGRESAERERIEERLGQAQRLEAIGRLAGGVAHDFNNLLQAITGSAEFLLDAPAVQDARTRADLEEILRASRQAAALTEQILAFGRQEAREPVVVDPGDVLRDMEPVLRRLVGAEVELVMELRPDAGHVRVDPTRLQQVVLNLVVNARDAMPQGGRIGLETVGAVIEESDVRGHLAARPGRYTALRVSDSGIGMDRAIQERLFEPFFTTKAASKGTGLGLSTVHEIVAQSGGLVAVESAPGRGSTFTVYLPHTDAPVETPRTAPASDQQDPGITSRSP